MERDQKNQSNLVNMEIKPGQIWLASKSNQSNQSRRNKSPHVIIWGKKLFTSYTYKKMVLISFIRHRIPGELKNTSELSIDVLEDSKTLLENICIKTCNRIEDFIYDVCIF